MQPTSRFPQSIGEGGGEPRRLRRPSARVGGVREFRGWRPASLRSRCSAGGAWPGGGAGPRGSCSEVGELAALGLPG